MKNKNLMKTAYHEAGHAVMHLVNRSRFKKITIIPEDDYLGQVTTYSHNDYSPNYNPDKKIMIFFAGEIAARQFMKKKISYRGCFGIALDLIISYSHYDNQKVRDAYASYLFLLTEHYIDKYWCAIEALAKELLDKRELGYHKARDIVFNALKDNKPLLYKIFLGCKKYQPLIDKLCGIRP